MGEVGLLPTGDGTHAPTLADRGFFARSVRPGGDLVADAGATSALGAHGDEVVVWGLPEWRVGEALLLAASVRRHEHDLTAAEVHRLLCEEPSAFSELLPTMAAATTEPGGGIRVATDYLGFRHVFYGQGGSAATISTSSGACARDLASGIDLEAVAVQSSLGWQLGQRTLFEGVQKTAPGGRLTLSQGRVSVAEETDRGPTQPIQLDEAVQQAARILRTHLASYLDDHPDVGLQLTGGQDSRLLLSAIPPSRRRGLRVVTLGQPGDPDVDIAAHLAARFGMRHELLSLSGLESLAPVEAHRLCLDAARRVDYSADPIAHAALSFAEAGAEPGPRLSGLGGEVARGFYYVGRPTSAPVTPHRARRLAEWRMFVNEAVPRSALEPAYGEWSRSFAAEEVVRALADTGLPWMAATDELYLGHRMQRWGGVTETAVCLDRQIVNPMLDDRFIAIARALQPIDKRGSRFLSRLQLELDPGLGAIPLDGRPPPATYAHRSLRNSAHLSAATFHRSRRKVAQRMRHRTRPPAGGEILAAKVVEHWRTEPVGLESLDALRVFRTEWLDDVIQGRQEPPPSAVALMVNLLAAVHQP